MSAEHQIEVVQRQRRKPVRSSDEGKNALGQLGENQILLIERNLERLDGANGEICCDVVQALARHMKQDVVECFSGQARGLRVKIEHGRPERWRVGRWNKLVVEPQMIIADR